MKVQVLIVACLASLCSSSPGIFLVQFGETEETNFCISYDSSDGVFPSSYDDEDFHPLVDMTPDLLCETPFNTSQLHYSIAIAPGTTNCTVTDRAAIAEEADAAALVVYAIDADLRYGNTTTNLSVALMREVDYNTLAELLNDHAGNAVEAVLYSPGPEVPRYDPNMFCILALAISIVAIGGYWSGVTSYKQYRDKICRTRAGSQDDESETEEDDEEETVTISTKVILVWVVMIVTFLCLLFFFYDIFVYVVIAMFCLGAWSSLFVCLIPFVRKVFRSKASTPTIPLLKTRYYYVSIVLAAVCLVPVVIWFVYRHEDFAWILQDILGAVFCISMLKLIHLPNFKLCILLLGLLFFYDLFFVFITPLFSKDGESVMIKAATGGEGATEKLPVLFMFPPFTSSPYKACKGYSLLGFGDVLIPGLLVGFCHGFDLKVKSKKVYFIGSLIAYGVGLLFTFVALIFMETGQPALVYIVPSTLLTVTLIGCLRRELKPLWHGGPNMDHIPINGEINPAEINS